MSATVYSSEMDEQPLFQASPLFPECGFGDGTIRPVSSDWLTPSTTDQNSPSRFSSDSPPMPGHDGYFSGRRMVPALNAALELPGPGPSCVPVHDPSRCRATWPGQSALSGQRFSHGPAHSLASVGDTVNFGSPIPGLDVLSGDGDDGDDNDDDGQDQDGSTAQRTGHSHSLSDSQGPLNCPYYRRNKRRFNVRDHWKCTKQYTNLSNVKSHIGECHKRTRVSDDVEDGITEDIAERLIARKNHSKISTWESLWRVLFPLDVDVPPQGMSLSNQIRRRDGLETATTHCLTRFLPRHSISAMPPSRGRRVPSDR
ncbi:hypothetical protein VTH06DRAFT_6883 [Thermothelomyces fergusii]